MQPAPQSSPPGDSAQPGYAPIAWSAVAALGLAGLFVVVLLMLAVGSYRNGLPLTDVWIPFVPALIVVLAFVARRQIRASEGTRSGEVYANAAWWVGVVSGFGFVAYLLGVNFTVQRDARQVFNGWADDLRELDPFNPKDPHLYSACWLTLPPLARGGSPKDTARIDQAFSDAIAGFRQTDLVRLCQRNRGQLALAPLGLKDWSKKASEITCVLSASVTCPEGEYGLELPMRAAVADTGQRRWQVQPPGEGGYVKTRSLTRRGWEVFALEEDGKAFARELLFRLTQSGQGPLVYLGYVHDGWDPNRAANALNRFVEIEDGLAALTGPVSLRAVRGDLLPRDRQPLPAGWYERLTQEVIGKPDGGKQTPADAERMLRALNSANQVVPPGTILKNNLDISPVLALDAREKLVELRVPVELAANAVGPAGSAFKGRFVFRLPPAEAAALLAVPANESTARSSAPPDDVKPIRRGWRLVRFESDLKAVAAEPPKQAPGGVG